MLLIQAVAALLLVAGSAVIFKALLELDAPTPARRTPSARRAYPVARPTYERDEDLPRAA